MSTSVVEPEIVESSDAMERLRAAAAKRTKVISSATVTETHRGWYLTLTIEYRNWFLFIPLWTTIIHRRLSLAVWPGGVAGICHAITAGATRPGTAAETKTQYTISKLRNNGDQGDKQLWRGYTLDEALAQLV